MQSCLWSKALCPAATGLHSRSSRLLVCQQIASRTARRRRIHGDGSNKAYPELEDILGKPATTFEQLIGQLETLIKHPNPPRNYADALAKNELRRVDRGDLTTDKSSGRHDSSRTMLLQQRPRMLRNMNSELDRGLSAEDAGMGAGQDELTDLSDIPEMSSNVPSTHEVSPLPEEVAINLGINSEQQERRRIWMTKIAGYRAFRSNLMSMNSLLNKELRSYEAEHGEHVLTSAQEALKLQRAFGQQSVGGLVDKDVEIGVNMASVGALADDSLADCMLAESQEGEAAESQENISDLLVRNFPRALRTFQQEAEQLMRSHIRELGDYWGMALHRGQTHVTVESLARLTFGKKSEDEPLDDVERLAAYMHMVSDPLHYIPDADGLFVTCRFELRPRSEVENIVRVRDLIRENAPEFTQFVGKARKLVAHAHAAMPLSPLRAALDPTVKSARASNSCKLTGWAPDLSFAKRKLPAEPVLTKDEVAKTEFTPEDSQFLLALRSYVFHANAGFQNLTNPYESLVSPILKKMHYYSGCDVTTVARFLVDVGVWPHWYNQKLNMRDQHHASFNRYRNTYLIERGAVASAALYYWGIPGSVDVDPAASTLAKPRLTEKQNVEKYKAEVKIAESIVPEVRCSVITQSSTGAGVIGKSALYGRDICEDIRHDFGNMPVYTIDDSTTRDVDDGLSLETIATLDGEEQEWIHVHIADPTALIHPGHLITHAAARQVATIYYTTDTRNMLPLGMVLDNISLVRRGDGSSPKEVYTMTISCRLGDDGDIAEYKIRPGIVRNIISSPYEVVDQHMSFERPLGGMDSLSRLQESKRMATYIHPFVPSDAELPLYGQKKTALSKEAIRTLRRIQELGRRHYDYRVRSGSFTRLLPSRDISINDGAKLTAPSFLMQRPTFLQAPYDSPEYSPLAYPKITSSYSSVILSPAHTMVGEMMVIAGRVAARFAYEHGPGTGGHAANSSGVIAGERGVPLLFRSQSMPNLDVLGGVAQGLPLGIEGLSASEAQSARAVWDAVIGQAKCNRGIISAKVFDEVRHMLNPSILSCTPGPHTIMGVTDKYGYTRITSPIRRLDDMIGHWQLKAQLLAMHTGSSDRQPWYWNHYDIERLAPIVFRRTQLIDSAARNDEEFWQLTLMRRMDSEARRGTLQLPPDGFYNPSSPLYFDTPWAYYNPGTPGPLTWTAMVDNRDETRPFISLVIVGLGTRAMLLPRPLDAALLPFAGTKVRVQIIGLDPAEAMLMVKLAPEEHQPVDTPKFWGSTRALNVIHSRFHLARTPPEDSY
ncbi:3'-5' RNA exonuclease complex component [Coemansia sp. BCRC 34301]|nr:3'-5' RNA exonuclease complex component [Coemansia sp. BCRC 34301]